MGVVNVTPDSFSDGGRFLARADAVAHALQLAADGADILDIGGESTRPGAGAVSEGEELDRVIPVLEALTGRTEALLSIDTAKPAVARAAAKAGAGLWNDVTALGGAPESLALAAALGVPVVLMHMQGTPATMQAAPAYGDVVEEVTAFLVSRVAAAEAAGLARENVLVDPGVGFGKTLAHNLALLRALPEIAVRTRRPLVLGASRKRFIQGVDGSARAPGDRLGGSLGAALWGAQAGAAILRVHDVRETVQALKVWRAIQEEPSHER